MAVTVYRYRVAGWWVRHGMPEVIDTQLRLAHDLRNKLVELQHGHETAMSAVWSSYPAVAEAEKRRDDAENRVAELAEQVAEARRKQRTRAPKTPAVAELKQARADLRQARQARRDAIAAVRDEAKQRLDQLSSELRAAQKQLYADYVQTDGLYWATYNDVTARFRTAVQRVAKRRREGQPAALRFHSWDGTGALAVQLQRGAGDPARTPELLASGSGKWRNVFRLSPWVDPDVFEQWSRGERRAHARTGQVVMRVGSQRLTIPLVAHRMLPPDADVTDVRLVVTRKAQRRYAHVCVTARVPDPEPVTDGPAVALHCGWRHESDGAIRVATWRADAALPVPSDVSDVVRADTDRSGIVVLPDQWRDGLARPDVIRAGRDTYLDTMRAALAAWLDAHPQPDGPTAGEVGQWRSPKRFARLAAQWADEPPAGSSDIRELLDGWRVWDRRQWGRQEHGRGKHLGRRQDGWRRVAAWLADVAGGVVVDDAAIASLARHSAREETSVPSEVSLVAARQRVDAAPGGLRADVTAAAKRDGVPVTTVAAAGLSSTCRSCGHGENPVDSHVVVCVACGHRYDRDTSATVLMLGRASGES